MTNRHIRPYEWERLAWNGSKLTSGETFIAAFMARLARHDADDFGWFTTSYTDIAAATKLHRVTIARHVDGLVDKEWLQVERPVVNGRYVKSRFRLIRPSFHVTSTDTEKLTRKGHHVTSTDSEKLTESVENRNNVLRSKYIEESTTARPQAAEEETTKGPTYNAALYEEVRRIRSRKIRP